MDKREEHIERMKTLIGDYIDAIRNYNSANEETLQNVLGLVGKINEETYSVFDALGIEFEPVPGYKDTPLNDLLGALRTPDGEKIE